MIKRVYLAAILALLPWGRAFSNPLDTSKNSIKVAKHDIEVVYSQYIQDGNNSAVTGGIGTEKLIVYSPSIAYKRKRNQSVLSLKGGSDIITSASTDNIDYVQSSASRQDARTYANINYGNLLKPLKINLEIGTGFSIESDYLSRNFTLGLNRTSKNKMRNVSFEAKLFFDDLRWGRINPNYKRPVKLIYPVELRNQNWFDIYKRNSYNFKFGISQIINKRNIVGFYPLYVYQNGLISTPFHRVIFNDSSKRVENLPNTRHKLTLILKWNVFLGGSTILKNTFESYNDNFGINGFALENETTFKLKSGVNISPFIRLYTQTASKYFAPFGQHQIQEEFYSSDYDLSNINTLKLGIEVKSLAVKKLNSSSNLKNINLRYAYFVRSNNLYAHIMTLYINIGN